MLTKKIIEENNITGRNGKKKGGIKKVKFGEGREKFYVNFGIMKNDNNLKTENY